MVPSYSFAQNISSISQLPKNQSLEVCHQMHKKIDELIVFTDQSIKEMELKDHLLVQDLLKKQKMYNESYQKSIQTTTNIKHSEENLERQQVIANTMHLELVNLNSSMTTIQKEIVMTRTKRIDGLIDIIPFVGFIGGLVTKRYMRMIPFYSVIMAIKSSIAKDKEKSEINLNSKRKENDSLNNKINITANEINNSKNVLKSLEDENTRLLLECSQLETAIKATGQSIAALREIHYGLKDLHNNYLSLNRVVDRLEFFINHDLAHSNIFNSLLNQLRLLGT